MMHWIVGVGNTEFESKSILRTAESHYIPFVLTKDPSWRLLFSLAYGCGLRLNEALNLEESFDSPIANELLEAPLKHPQPGILMRWHALETSPFPQFAAFLRNSSSRGLGFNSGDSVASLWIRVIYARILRE
jgi:hypothetical protein